MNVMKLMTQRHSVRQYTATPIEGEKREILNTMVAQINEEADLHIQILYEEPGCFDSFMAHYGKFSGVRNYIALVGPKGEELEEKLGYYGEKLVLKAQELGLNTCWVALTHGKSKADVAKGEKHGCILALGYGENVGVPHKSKPMDALCTVDGQMPDWFRRGMEAAMEAPTAMNQQKFHFRLLPEGKVTATAGKGFYTKVDFGIAKCHFELGAEKENLF